MDEKTARQAAQGLGIDPPKSAADLRQLLERFGPVLSQQNRDLLNEVIATLESGGDQDALAALAARYQNKSQ